MTPRFSRLPRTGYHADMNCTPWLVGVFVGLLGAACFAEPDDGCATDSCGAAGSSGGSASTGEPATTTSPSTATTASAPATGDSSAGDDTTASDAGSSSVGAVDGSSTGAELCGNGVLDPGEECDGTEACTGCELDNFDCNPLNNAGCPDGSKCAFNDDTGLFWCLPFLMDTPGGLHEGNCFSGGPQDDWCDVGLACMPAVTNGACTEGACCVEFCDIFDAAFECAQKGDECIVWFLPDAPDGLEWLGFCGTP